MELLDSQSIEFDDFLRGHLNTMIGSLGIIVSGRYARRFIARIKKISEDKVFVFANLSGGPVYVGRSIYKEWRILEKKWWQYGNIIVKHKTMSNPRYKPNFLNKRI